MIRKQRKQDMAKRRTAAGQERMRIISQLARKEKGNDDFGMRDEDWDIYKTISKDGNFILFFYENFYSFSKFMFTNIFFRW